MGLSDILGSLSPGFGMLSGKGLFGGSAMNSLGGSGLFGLLGMLLHHSGGANAPAAQAASAGQSPGGMPGTANPYSALGSAMQSSAAPDPGVQLGAMPQQSNGLQALLQQIIGQ